MTMRERREGRKESEREEREGKKESEREEGGKEGE
jgi:hypothetical protein